MINKIKESIISHDKDNNRIYLMKLHTSEARFITEVLEEVARRKVYTKIFVKVPSKNKALFLKKGYSIEAVIPRLYKGVEDGLLLGKYFSKDRQIEKDRELVDKVFNEAIKNKDRDKKSILREGLKYKKAEEADCLKLANFYKMNFKTYPFPIYEDKYILETMKDNVIYFTIWDKEEVVAASSCEIDMENLNAEMTDFATNTQYRNSGIACFLLTNMEEEMKKIGIKTVYTIARSKSYGMNITFSKKGYIFAGKLINNTNISGDIESMNVWYKEI